MIYYGNLADVDAYEWPVSKTYDQSDRNWTVLSAINFKLANQVKISN